MTAVAGQELGWLRSRLSGRMITAVDDEDDHARSVWNGAIDRHPAVIARGAGPGDVARAAGFAQQAGLEISARAAAHNFGGAAVGDGGLTGDLSAMRQVLVDPEARTARGQPTLGCSARHCPPVTCCDTAGTPPEHRMLAGWHPPGTRIRPARSASLCQGWL